MFFLVRPCPKPKKQYLEKPYNSLAMAIKSRVGVSKSLITKTTRKCRKTISFFELRFGVDFGRILGYLGGLVNASGGLGDHLGRGLRDALGTPRETLLGRPGKIP